MMAAKKRPDFGGIAKRTINKPSSMGEFLKNDAPAAENRKASVSKQQDPPVTPEPKTPSPQLVSAQTESVEPHMSEGEGATESSFINEEKDKKAIRLTYATTLNLDPDIMDELEMLWVKLRRNAPVGKKKKISKSLLINLMIASCVKEINEDVTGHPIVKAIADMI
jgi:hypothetical protein